MSQLAINPALLVPASSGVTPVSPSPQPATPPPTQTGTAAAKTGASFADTLAKTQTPTPTFSKHALERLQRRGIDLDSQTLGRLSDGIQRAADKGARNSVVFVDGTAFVASVQNNTVITAVSPEHMRSQVFTNIDSAVVA